MTSSIPPVADSPLAMSVVRLGPGAGTTVGDDDRDTFLFAFEGGATDFARGGALFVPAGERREVVAGDSGLAALRFEAGPACDEHAPLGELSYVAAVDREAEDAATGSRTFQILFGPHNGSCRATLFVGYVPPGRAPWHFHQYDEIVWIWKGSARFHTRDGEEPLEEGAAVRMTPRQVHTLENLSADSELVLLGFFTPAGSPAAAYLAR